MHLHTAIIFSIYFLCFEVSQSAIGLFLTFFTVKFKYKNRTYCINKINNNNNL